jgi:hypothetical protein
MREEKLGTVRLEMHPRALCSRCMREPSPAERCDTWGIPEGWEGSASQLVCPGCQPAAWHPRCTSLRADSGYGDRVDLAALESGESLVVTIDEVPVRIASLSDLTTFDVGTFGWCDFIDWSVSWVEDEDFPEEWSCPKCGGTEFEGVHDYRPLELLEAEPLD